MHLSQSPSGDPMTIRAFLAAFLLSFQLAMISSSAVAAENSKKVISFPLEVDMTGLYLPLEGADRMEALGNIVAGAARQLQVDVRQDLLKHTHFVLRPSGDARVEGPLIDGMVKAIRDSKLENIGID